MRFDVATMLGTRALVLLLSTATSVVLARALGPSGRGLVAVAFSFGLLLTQFGTLGLVTANPYFAAKEPQALGRIVSNSLWLAAGLGTMLAALGAVLKLLAPGVVRGLGWEEVAVVLVGIPAALAAAFLHSILLGEGRTGTYNATELTLAVLTFVAMAVGLLVFDLGVLGALVLMASSYVVSAVAYLGLLLRHRPDLTWPDTQLAGRMLKYAGRVYLATVLAYLVVRIDLLLVNGVLGADDAGLYAVAVALADGMLVLPVVVSINLFARVARGAEAEASARAFRLVAIIFGAACLVAIPLAAPGIELLFGARFAGAAELFYWLLPGIFCFGMLNILSHHFAGRGFPLEAALIWFAGLAVNLAINVLFLAEGGAFVAPLASSVAYLLLLVLYMRMFAAKAGGYSVMLPRLREFKEVVRGGVHSGLAAVHGRRS